MTNLTLVITTGCPTCNRAEFHLKKIVNRRKNISLDIVDLNNYKDMKIFIVPALIINDELFCYGDIDETKLLEKIDQKIKYCL